MSLGHITASGKKIGQEPGSKDALIQPPGKVKAGGIFILVIHGLSNRFGSFYFSSEYIELRAVLLQVVERISTRENQYRQ